MTNLETAAPATAAATRRDPYALAADAGERLTQNPHDEDARAAYEQALALLKLLDSERRSLIPWASRARRFAANLRALEERTPAGAALVRDAAGDLARYELHHAADGNFQILDPTLPVWAAWLGGQRGQLTHHKATEHLWAYDPQRLPMPAPLLFDGMGFAWLFLQALRSTEQAFLNYRCAFYVLERDPLALAMAMHLHDMQEVIRSPRTRWFIGATDAEVIASLHNAVAENPSSTLPEIYVRSNLRPRKHLPIEETINTLRTSRQTQRETWGAEAITYYAGKDAAFWHARFSAVLNGTVPCPAKPLRVLGITSRYTTVLQYSMAELQTAVSAWASPAGATADMRIAIEPDDQSMEHPLLEMIADFKPDLIVQISRMRYESPHIPRNVPFLCWDQDNLPCMRTPEATASLNAFTYVAGHGAIYGYTFLRWSETNLVFCQPVGATFRYSGAPAAPENLARYACDISFISNASGAPEQIRDQQRAAWQNAPAAAALYHHVSALVLDAMDAGGSWDYWSLHDAIEQAAAAHGVRLNTSAKQEMIMALTLLSDRCFRHAALQWVSRWCEKTGRTLRLYGRGWENHPAYARYAAGYAPQGAELAAIYQASTINLHLMETGGFLHSRPLDGLAAGGFFLTRTSPNDGFHPRHGPAQITLAERAQVLGLRTRADLDACTDPAVVHAWSIMRRFFTDLRPDERFAGFTLWRELPTACVLFPQLADLTFSTAERFEALAEKYLADENARQSTAHAMRSIVLRELSYTRRWQQFLEGITHGLGAAAKEPAVPLSAAAAVPCTVG